MKALFVRRLYLWPRFEAHVKDTLNDLSIEVGAQASRKPAMWSLDRCLRVKHVCTQPVLSVNHQAW